MCVCVCVCVCVSTHVQSSLVPSESERESLETRLMCIDTHNELCDPTLDYYDVKISSQDLLVNLNSVTSSVGLFITLNIMVSMIPSVLIIHFKTWSVSRFTVAMSQSEVNIQDISSIKHLQCYHTS